MHLTNWLHGLTEQLSRTRRHQRIKRRKQLRHTPPIERLEDRILLTAPEAFDDGVYDATDDKLDTAADSLDGVLFNDTDAENDPLTAVLDIGPSNGSLTLNSDGSFVYTANTDYTGTDSFT